MKVTCLLVQLVRYHDSDSIMLCNTNILMIPGLGDDKIRMTDYRTKVEKQKQAGPSLKVKGSSFHHDCVLQGAHCLDNHNF